jgi:hypothetical protein
MVVNARVMLEETLQQPFCTPSLNSRHLGFDAIRVEAIPSGCDNRDIGHVLLAAEKPKPGEDLFCCRGDTIFLHRIHIQDAAEFDISLNNGHGRHEPMKDIPVVEVASIESWHIKEQAALVANDCWHKTGGFCA